jgi:hypothetical protein
VINDAMAKSSLPLRLVDKAGSVWSLITVRGRVIWPDAF